MSRSSGTTRRRRRHGQPAACEAKRYAICGIENHGFRGVTNGNKKLASNAKRYPLCKNRRIPFTRNPPVSCLLGRCPNPRRTQNCVLKRRINPSATRFCKSLMGGHLNAAPPLFHGVHSFPPAPCPVPEYGRYWPWLSAALSYPRGLFGTRHKPPFSPPAARRTPYSEL